jgi:hypothetical protein
VIPDASDEHKNNAVFATSSAEIALFRGERLAVASIIASISPTALAALEAYGPALIKLIRWPNEPISHESMRASLSSAAFAEAIPPP